MVRSGGVGSAGWGVCVLGLGWDGRGGVGWGPGFGVGGWGWGGVGGVGLGLKRGGFIQIFTGNLDAVSMLFRCSL